MSRQPQHKSKTAKRPNHSNTLRIIGGQWKRRKLSFVDAAGLRPTSDRTRETLFNWLQAPIYKARCLDLFAGSGALGFESLSRGAGEVVMVEKNAKAADRLKQNKTLLAAESCTIMQGDALRYLESAAEPFDKPFDIVFLDPPFRQQWLPKVVALLETKALLADGAYVYIEQEQDKSVEEEDLSLPAHWELLKELKSGQVWGRLYWVEAVSA